MTTEEFNLIWPIIKDTQEHISILNKEMGMVQAELAIIKWFMAGVIMLSLGSVIPAVWSLILHKRNKR